MEQLTVLLAVYNGQRYLPMAIESILQQTYRNFRFLIVDDASGDQTRQIIRSMRDPRIDGLFLDRNVGHTAALNIGLRSARTPWIARMDADDYSAPTRLEEQIRRLHEEPSLRGIGTFAWVFRDDPRVMEEIVKRPVDYPTMKREILRGTPMIHASLLFHREALLEIGGYDERYRITADRELYGRLLARYRAVNLPKPLYGIRRHSAQGSYTATAARETVDLFSRMLSEGRYSPEEKATLRESLVRAHLFCARCSRKEHRYLDVIRCVVSALRASPRAAFKQLTEKLKRNEGVWEIDES
ncbi:MAG: glycosyltransferase family 2 protein [Candidatus Omnitrophica bacterium]|nr:glycosyltransferase family 2 protein [Candidatus Omnitrophota bacterium]